MNRVKLEEEVKQVFDIPVIFHNNLHILHRQSNGDHTEFDAGLPKLIWLLHGQGDSVA